MSREVINLDRPVETEDGHRVVLMCTDAKSTLFPLIGKYWVDGQYTIGQWDRFGNQRRGGLSVTPVSLRNKSEKKTCYSMVQLSDIPCYSSHEEAKRELFGGEQVIELVHKDQKILSVKLA